MKVIKSQIYTILVVKFYSEPLSYLLYNLHTDF